MEPGRDPDPDSARRRAVSCDAPYFFRDERGGGGTFPPARRASERPMAMACFRLVTFLPEPPLRSVPRFISCMVFSTFSAALSPYLRLPEDLRAAMRDLPCRCIHKGACKPLARSAAARPRFA